MTDNIEELLNIPKRIFYVWLGGLKSPLANVCLHNWKQKLKDYEIIEINESSPYFDFEYEYKNCKYFKNRYDNKEWAFVSDYIRCKVLYDYGGIYLDTDVTVEKDFTPLLKNEFFVGEELPKRAGVGVIGSVKNHQLLKEMLDFYNDKNLNGGPLIIPDVFEKVLKNYKGNDYKVYPCEYFYPFYLGDEFKEDCLTENTYVIHWWNNSWAKNPTFFQKVFSVKNEYSKDKTTKYKIITILGKRFKIKSSV